MRKDTADQSFVEKNLPRHEPIEALRKLIAAKPEDKAEALVEYFGAFTHTADTTKSRPEDLIELYMIDIRAMFRDYEDRPSHYTPRQHDILMFLVMKYPVNPEPTAEEKNDLVLTYLRASATDKQKDLSRKRYEAEQRKREAEENEETVMEDGRNLNEVLADEKNRNEPTFEKQDYQDKVLI